MPPACSSPLLPITGHGHALPWLPSLCVGWWVGVHCRITPGFLPACPLVQHSDSSHPEWSPPCPRPGVLEGASSLSHPANPGPHSARPGLLISPLPPDGPNASPQAVDCPKPPVPPRFHHSHQKGGISPQQLHLLRWQVQTATPPLTSGREVAAGCRFVLPPRLLPGAVSTSRDDSKPGRRSLHRCLF